MLTPSKHEVFPPGVVHADVSRRLPALDSSADFVYSSHMIEHLNRWQGLAFVRECHRVLRPGGLVRLATPDLRQIVIDYLDGTSPLVSRHPTRADAFCAEYGAYADPQANSVRRLLKKFAGGDSHQWLYDADSLEFLLREGGFSQVRRCDFREGALPELDRIERRERGLFMEARP